MAMTVKLNRSGGGLGRNVQTNGPGELVLVDFTAKYSAIYAAGGEAITIPLLKMVKDVVCQPEGTNFFRWNRATGKIEARVLAGGAEVANGTDLTAVEIQCVAWGTV